MGVRRVERFYHISEAPDKIAELAPSARRGGRAGQETLHGPAGPAKRWPRKAVLLDWYGTCSGVKRNEAASQDSGFRDGRRPDRWPALRPLPRPRKNTSSSRTDSGSFLVERHNLPLIHIAAAVDAGVKDETDATSGLVHLLEHCVLFRGTERRSGSDVGREIRERGAYFNAHTGRDLSVFEISLGRPTPNSGSGTRRKSCSISILRQDELDREKDVILEEISQLEDDPDRYARDLALARLFAGHPYGRSVYGDREAIRGARAEDMRAFHDRYFVPANCGLAVVGDRPLADLESLVTGIFGAVPKAEAPGSALPPAGPPPRSSRSGKNGTSRAATSSSPSRRRITTARISTLSSCWRRFSAGA